MIGCNAYIVHLHSGFVCGFTTKFIIDDKQKCIKHASKTIKATDKIKLKLKRDEHLVKIKVGYCDKGVKAINLYTDYQKQKLGDIKTCEFVAKSSQNSAEIAIVGFELSFDENRLVETGVFLAPIIARVNINKTDYKRRSSLAVFNEEHTQLHLQPNNTTMIKHIFRAYKNLKHNTSW